jgi:hypothetical protein
MDDFLKNPKHWRIRAEQTRAKAESLWRDDAQKRKLLRVAAEYDQLAERAAQWQAPSDVQDQQ